MTCETCKFASSRPKEKTRLQEWQEDPRPVAPNIFAWLWNPQKYKDKNAYSSRFGKLLDHYIIEDNETLAYCDRYPKRTVVDRNYKCGEYKFGGPGLRVK